MERLTFSENGRVFVMGMNKNNQNEKLSLCIHKLKEYEDSGLSPQDIKNMLGSNKMITRKKCCRSCGYYRMSEAKHEFVCMYYVDNEILNQALLAEPDGYCENYERRN